jgi:phosphoribosylanthranilate isomerase
MSALVKICGLTTPDAMTTAIEGGADFIGLVFHPASPRYIDIEVAAYLANYVPGSVKVVGLFVDPTDEKLTQTLQSVRLDIIQLHGSETPARVAEIKGLTGKNIVKVLPVASVDDLVDIPAYEAVADWLMVDAKGTAENPGGTGKTFDWNILKDFSFRRPWMLAGGLTEVNVAEAIISLKPTAVDVSSGVEASRGVKDPAKIKAFLKAAKSV